MTKIIKRVKYKIGNIDWELVVKMESRKDAGLVQRYFGSIKNILVDFYCLYEHRRSIFWAINAEISINGTGIMKTKEHCFHRCSTSLEFGKFCEMDKNSINDVNIWAYVKIKSTVGIERIELTDFSIPKNINSEIVLRLGNHKFYVDRYSLMCIQSKFRENLGASIEEIEINGVEPEDFLVFLRLLYQQKNQITTENVQFLITLAKQYDIDFLTAYCEEFFISTGCLTIREKIYQAAWNQFPKLQLKALENLKSLTESDIEELSLNSRSIGSPAVRAVLVQRCKMSSEKERTERIRFLSLAIVVLFISSFCYTCILVYFAG